MDRRGRPERYSSLDQEDFKTPHIKHKKILNTISPLPPKDPRLSHDKYRAQIMKHKTRISPDTTMSTKKSVKQEKVGKLDKYFRCSLCSYGPTTAFESIGEVRAHLQQLHAIEGQEVWDPLTIIPKAKYLKAYKCKACPPTASAFIVSAESEMLEHFKSKHKIPVLKPILLNRVCRLNEKDGFKSDAELEKYINTEFPPDHFAQDESEAVEDGNEHELEASTSRADEDYFKNEDALNYEPDEPERSPSPPSPPREEASIPEDGECSDSYPKSKYRKDRKRSASSSSRSSRSRSTQSSSRSRPKKKKKPKQYKDSSRSSSSESEVKGRGRRSPSPPPTKRKVYMTNSSKGGKKKDELFGQTYIPPAGFCDECNERYESGDRAQAHFKSQRHYYAVKNKLRCSFCNAYVTDMKGHLESRHRDMTFQCKLDGCNRPRFTQSSKVIDHIRTNHPREYKKTSEDMDMFRQGMISLPKSLASYTCKESKMIFHGDLKIAIVHLVLEHGINVPQRYHFDFSCRFGNPRDLFRDEVELQEHCDQIYADVYGSRGRPSSSRSRSRSRSVSRSRSRSRSPMYKKESRNHDDFYGGRGPRSPPPQRQGGGFGGRGRGGFQGHQGGRGGFRGGYHGERGGQQSNHYDRRSDGLGYDHRQDSRSQQGGSFTCHYCPDVFRTPAIRKTHMLNHHQKYLFQCALCTFKNMYRRDLAWHLREHHRKTLPDDILTREYVHWPNDMRKIMCGKCSETEAHDNAVWCSVDPDKITRELESHAEKCPKCNYKDDNVESCFVLGCVGCSVKFQMDGELRDWDDHIRDQPCKRGRPAKSRSRSRSHDRSRDASPVEVNLDTHCLYCCKQIDDKNEMEEHVRKRHLDVAFVCRLCETGSHHFEPDLISAQAHLKDVHDKDHDLDIEETMDYFRFPKNLVCIKCNLCGLLCHAQKVEDLEMHFNVCHPGTKFSESHLDFLSRLDMKSGQFDAVDELEDHLQRKYPDLV